MSRVNLFSKVSGTHIPSEPIESEPTEPAASLEFRGVKITPGHMIFENAYEGKRFEKTLIIQNCGSHSALVRLTEPSSRTFKFKAFKEGISLSPGMRVIRTVKYKYSQTFDVLSAFATIYVGEESQKYHFSVSLTQAILSIEPGVIDFGSVDAVNHAATRAFQIINTGHKGAQFSIDLGRNPLEMIVNPMKGMVHARSSVRVAIEIAGSEAGDFTEEFWIKSQPPLRVVVVGSFIAPKLLVRKFINSLDFTLVDFKPTYYGTSATQSLLIRNYSSSNCMFCVLAEIKGTTMPLEEAKEIDDNYRNFNMRPIDGRLAPLKGAIIQITFSPVRTRKKEKSYSACFLKIVRMDCRDITSDDKLKGLHLTRHGNSLENYPTFSAIVSTSTYMTDLGGGHPDMMYQDEDISDTLSFEHAIGVCIYGEKLQADVLLSPTSIKMEDLTLNQNYQRVLLFTNKSTLRPITVQYQKIASIDVIPQQFEIKPDSTLEVLLTIRTLKLNHDVRKVTFALLSYDAPEETRALRKVGTAALQIETETTEVAKKEKTAHCAVRTDVALRVPPGFPYRLTQSELARKNRNDEYYLNYVRSLWTVTPFQENPDHSSVPKCHKLGPVSKPVRAFTAFIPLAPRLLHNIKITPKSIKIRKVAAFTTITDFFQIENSNTFPIRVYVDATKPCVAFSKCRYVIKSKENKKIYFTFSSDHTGRYFITINILVNDSTLYEVSALAQVLPKTLKVESTEIEFTENDGHYKFLKLTNALNAYTSFEWDVPQGCFQVYPQNGGIKAGRFLLCMITYTADPAQPNVSECTLTSESGQQQVIVLSSRKEPSSVVFDKYQIDAGIIPLNVAVRKKVILMNLKTSRVSFNVERETEIPGITIEPTEGILEGLDSQVFVIHILLTAVIEFSTEILFNVNTQKPASIKLKGAVDYPRVVLKPDSLYFRKISPYSYDSLAFKVKNLSQCEVSVVFPDEEFPEFSITDSETEQYPHQRKIVLQANCSEVLFLHFHPNYISTYSLYLPYIVNDILGPVLLNNPLSNSPSHFFVNHVKLYEQAPHVRFKPVPPVLSAIRLNCSAIDKILEFSSLSLAFTYFGRGHYNNVTEIDFEITNVSTETAVCCIRTDDLEPPFSLRLNSDAYMEYRHVSYMIILDPGEQIILAAEFAPSDVGTYSIKLPIFLEKYYDNKIFNYLSLEGVFKTPTITAVTERCDFEPVPVKFTGEINLLLHLKDHFKECHLVMESDLPGLYTSFSAREKTDPGDFYMDVTLSYENSKTTCFDTTIYFRCSCDSVCSVAVTGVAENCVLTTHATTYLLHNNDDISNIVMYSEGTNSTTQLGFHRIHRNDTCFPLFPADDDSSLYGVYMRGLQKVLQNWISSQVFYGKHYFKIPEGFADFCKVAQVRKMAPNGKAKYVEVPFLQLMMNIAGVEVREKLAPSALPNTDDETAWLTYVCTVNSKILDFLRGFPVFLPHVSAKFLLNYDHYVLYEKLKRPEKKPMRENIHFRRSKQCWIDVFLQIIKVFFVFRSVQVVPMEEHLSKHLLFPSSSLSLSESMKATYLDWGIYGEWTKELLKWLEECYDKEKDGLWRNQDAPFQKHLAYLDRDLRDGLVLGAVTAHYCPYVKGEIEEMYTRPYNLEELHHNACVLVKTWRTLQFSYVISPLSFQDSGAVEMLLLATYLYNVLPHSFPKEELTIQAPLTQANTRSVVLTNLGQDPIIYKVLFFGNQSKLFTVNSDYVMVQPRRDRVVKIRYLAKSVNKSTAHLLFSGETPGQKYGKSVAFSLVGVADVSYSCMQISVTVDLYRLCQINIHAQSPFKVKANYNLLFGYKPVTKEGNVLFPWEVVKNLKTVKELVLEDGMCQFDEHGQSTTTQMMCCQQFGTRNMWLYYTNPAVGDWGIQLTVTGRATEACYETIRVPVPQNYHTLACRCKGKISVVNNCPLVLHVRLPMKNNPLWHARKSMVLQYVQGEELNFWAQRIFLPIGTRILKLILNSETHPMRQVIEETVEYKVVLDKPSPLITLRRIVIDDVTSEDDFDFPIHPTDPVGFLNLKRCSLRLVSADDTDTRFYRLVFEFPNEGVRSPKVSMR